jgi:peptidoglycan hydrolase-like protein with peptidoglycan-binding domain
VFKGSLKIFFLAIVLLVMPVLAIGQSSQEVDFSIERSYDLYNREKISATLVKTTAQLYFYIDADWWDGLSSSEKRDIDKKLDDLGKEFERKIYPTLTSTFGFEWKPGIDEDDRITVLIHPMKGEAGGYFSNVNEYYKLQVPASNEREMLYLNSRYIDKPEEKSFLAHEFVHLITVNQKDLLRGVTEETWLNEARAEYAPTLLGYDETYRGSNLERRVKDFLEEPSNSLTGWLNESEDYGVVNLFTQYLVDRYGVEILADSMHSSKVGIPSINEALAKNGFKKDFSQVFSDWAITVLINDCGLGENYCYSNEDLKDLRLTPTLYYLPRAETVLSTLHETTYWAANWQRFIGGGDYLTLEFDGADSVGFKVPYLLCDPRGDCLIEFLTLDNNQNGKVTISEFNKKYNSLIVVPFIKSRTSGFNGSEAFFTFSLKVSTGETAAENGLIEQLLTQIDYLQKEIARVKAEINAILESRGQKALCSRFENNLYYGLRNNAEVSCLQEFLKLQGSEIYPEGLVTGNFLSLTQSAVIRFQEKYAAEILAPLGLEKGTGFVGEKTRAKINELSI